MKRFFIVLCLVLSLLSCLAQKSDSIVSYHLSYERLKDCLYECAPHHMTAAFVNLDYTLSEELLQWYILTKMNLVHYLDGSRWENPSHWIEEYRETVSIGNDIKYIKVHYYIKETDDKPMNPKKQGKCKTLVKCVIEGTPTLIAKLFSSYWVEEAEIGGNKGESAHKFFMGDRIALLKVSEGQWRIEITDNGRSFNYKQNFSQEEGVEIRTVRHYFIEN